MQKTDKIIVVYAVIYTLLDQRQEYKEGVNWKVARVPQILQITNLHNHKVMIPAGVS
jgi:ABC-type sugar transport system ATPase subunit